MKKILFAMTSVFFLLFQTTIASGQIPGQIESGFKTGNARMVANYFNDNVELVILDKENICSKVQGEMILSDFLNKNKPTDFKITHQSGTDSVYGIGKLQTSGTNYRIILMMKSFSGKSLIVQLRIEKD